MDQLLGRLFIYCRQGKWACNCCKKEKRWKDICQKHFIMVKKYKHISDSHDNSDIDSIGFAEMNTEESRQWKN